MKKPERKEIKIKCLQGQMKEGEKEIDCSGYPRGMKHEVLARYQNGYVRGLSIGVDQACDEWEKYLRTGVKFKGFTNNNSLPNEEQLGNLLNKTWMDWYGDEKMPYSNELAKAISKRIRGEQCKT